MPGFYKKYFIAFLILFMVEVGIAVFIEDRIIRPYLGDVLVVILLYCFVRSFFNLRSILVAGGVLGFAILIEILQYFHAVELLGLEKNRIARTVLGSSFDWMDVMAYIMGVVLVLIIDRKDRSRPVPTKITT